MHKQCVNCPGAVDHSTAECPIAGRAQQALGGPSTPELPRYNAPRGTTLSESDKGELVMAADHDAAIDALRTQVAELRAQNERLKRSAQTNWNEFADGIGEAAKLRTELDAARGLPAAPAVVNHQVTTADLTSVRCQCCQAEHAADSYDAGFIAGSGMCQVCDAAMPPKDLPVAGIEEVEVVAYQSGRSGMCYGEPYGLEVAKPLMTVEQHRRILNALINTPHTDEWFDAVRLEAAHQIQRWGTDHDAGKQPADWFWLLGYLGQKAMTAQIAGDEQKAKHHTISSGAMLLNWFRALVGDTNAMRPGIAQYQQEQQP
ncbi:MAG: hypothetical protein AB1459_04760 [Pseudomonadota bacterium]